jgi:hypothetical protein
VQPVAVKPVAGLAAVDRPHSGDAAGIAQDPHIERAGLACPIHCGPFVRGRAHVGGGGEPVGEHQFLRLGQRRIQFRRRRGRDLRFNQAHRGIDEQTILDPAPGRSLGVEAVSGRLDGGAIRDRGMAVYACQPDRPVANHKVDVGRGWKALVAPPFLVPAAAKDPPRIGIGLGIGLQPLLNLGQRPGARQVELQRGEAEAHDMAVGVDQAWQERSASAIHFVLDRPVKILGPLGDLFDPAIVVDYQRAEMLKLPVGADLNAIDVVNQPVCCEGGRRGEERGQRE